MSVPKPMQAAAGFDNSPVVLTAAGELFKQKYPAAAR
jgi:hypothetical protein